MDVVGLPGWARDLFRSSPAIDACARCGSTRHLIRGDGALVCRPCLMCNGDLVAHPERLTAGEYALLREAHGDVVALGYDVCVHGSLGRALLGHYRPVWRWIASMWPSDDEVLDDVDPRIQSRLDAIGGG